MSRTHRRLDLILLAALLAALTFVIILMFTGSAPGQTKRASSTVYAQSANVAPGYRKFRKYRYSYRRSRSRIAASRARVAEPAVVQPVSRAALLDVPHDHVAKLFRPYHDALPDPVPEPHAQFIGEVMLERGDPEPAAPGNFSLWIFTAFTIVVMAACFFVVTRGGQHDGPKPSQWA